MKPKPFSELNHLTVPCATTTPRCSILAPSRSSERNHTGEAWFARNDTRGNAASRAVDATRRAGQITVAATTAGCRSDVVAGGRSRRARLLLTRQAAQAAT